MTHTLTIHRFDATDPRLGRHVHHDSRSLDYEFLPREATPDGVSVTWTSLAAPLNQGNVGSCTGNATAQFMNTDFAKLIRRWVIDNGYVEDHYFANGFLTEHNAVDIYSLATKLDNVKGSYPPDDTGSSGIYVAKAAEKLGFLRAYKHTFSASSARAGIEKMPAIQGTVWTNTMFKPHNGLVKVGKLVDSNIAGGHEYLRCGVDFKEEVDIYRNSWGDSDVWHGCKPGGYFAMSFKDSDALLAQQGDVTFLLGNGLN